MARQNQVKFGGMVFNLYRTLLLSLLLFQVLVGGSGWERTAFGDGVVIKQFKNETRNTLVNSKTISIQESASEFTSSNGVYSIRNKKDIQNETYPFGLDYNGHKLHFGFPTIQFDGAVETVFTKVQMDTAKSAIIKSATQIKHSNLGNGVDLRFDITNQKWRKIISIDTSKYSVPKGAKYLVVSYPVDTDMRLPTGLTSERFELDEDCWLQPAQMVISGSTDCKLIEHKFENGFYKKFIPVGLLSGIVETDTDLYFGSATVFNSFTYFSNDVVCLSETSLISFVAKDGSNQGGAYAGMISGASPLSATTGTVMSLPQGYYPAKMGVLSSTRVLFISPYSAADADITASVLVANGTGLTRGSYSQDAFGDGFSYPLGVGLLSTDKSIVLFDPTPKLSVVTTSGNSISSIGTNKYTNDVSGLGTNSKLCVMDSSLVVVCGGRVAYDDVYSGLWSVSGTTVSYVNQAAVVDDIGDLNDDQYVRGVVRLDDTHFFVIYSRSSYTQRGTYAKIGTIVSSNSISMNISSNTHGTTIISGQSTEGGDCVLISAGNPAYVLFITNSALYEISVTNNSTVSVVSTTSLPILSSYPYGSISNFPGTNKFAMLYVDYNNSYYQTLKIGSWGAWLTASTPYAYRSQQNHYLRNILGR